MRKLILLLPILLTGCAGGTFGNLVPLPKILDGILENGVYTSPKGSFRVLSPFPEGKYEFTYMEVNEGGKDNWETFGFAPQPRHRRFTA